MTAQGRSRTAGALAALLLPFALGGLSGCTPTFYVLQAAEGQLEILSERWPLVVVAEDLHWIDDATTELLHALMRRAQPARLFLLASCRPAESSRRAPRRGAALQRLIAESDVHLQLKPLSAADVKRYLSERFSPAPRGEQNAGLLDAMIEANWTVLMEDLASQASAQKAMQCGALDALRLQYQERRIRYVHEEIDRRIGAERIAPALRVPALLDAFIEKE